MTGSEALALFAVRQACMRYPLLRWIDHEELVAMTRPALVRCAREFDESLGFKFSAFAVRSMMRDLIKHAKGLLTLKRRGRAVQLSVLEAAGEPGGSPFVLEGRAGPRPSDRLHARQLAEAALRVLAPRHAEVLRLRYFEGLTLEEAGDRLGVSGERVRQLEGKALRLARERLEATHCDL